MSAPQQPLSRPRVVDVAFWLLAVGAVVLIGGGMLAATVSFDAARGAIDSAVSDEQVRQYLMLYRGMGIGSVLSGAGLAFLAGRTRGGDARFRRATIGLGLAVTVLLAILAFVFAVAQPVTLAAVLPIVAGVILLTRPASSAWYTAKDPT
ncbi:hypothetical protein O6P37_26525 [Mycobacterium sp. CPCC 205372]|uniref:Integral membrane protein n=1 Tax=Mycobacterium hippophais TaxID=3016340 RepID=A0ABT4Q0R1_9MYCO|nr:hypothetical protein [Mycobacterium hippophais]MCZ8382429.1 hypothetical protein [Mycobacterium hippophais]